VVRTRLEIWLRSDQAAASELQAAALGMAVVSDEASTAGVASMPTPVSEADSDLWFLWQYIHGDEDHRNGFSKSETRITIDSRAMRKVERGEDVVVVGEMDSTISNGVVLGVVGRMLVKLN